MNIETTLKDSKFCDGCPSYNEGKEQSCFLGIEGFKGGHPKHRPQACIDKLGEDIKDNTVDITTGGGRYEYL